MEVYPPELTSPPVPLVALIGRSDLHILIGEYLRTAAVPRILSIGMPDPLQAAAKFGEKGPPKSPSTAPAGILKANWLQKHRGSRPAVAVLLVGREQVTGDPASWTRLVAQLEAVKGAARPRGVRLVVVVVQGLGEGELPDDRAAMICRQAGIEKRCLLRLSPAEGAGALAGMARALQEQCAAFYAWDAQRRLSTHSQKVGASPLADSNLRVAFKLGILAEFRADWPTAVHMYGEAYSYVEQAPMRTSPAGGSPPLQRFAELRTVAEFVHVKLVSVLLLALKQGEEALAQLGRHLRAFKRPPLDMPPGLLGSHHAWLCRQYMVMAELLVTSGIDLTKLQREQQPSELYLAAARAAIDRRRVAEFIRGVHGGMEWLPQLAGQVVAGQYVGQVVLADAHPRRLSDQEFVDYLEVEECRAPHSRQTVDLLRAAHEGLLRGAGREGASAPAKSLRHVSMLMGQEQMEGGDARGARVLLDEVAAYYRHAGWAGPLFQALMLLRECTHRLGDARAHAAYSLEVAALQGPLDTAQRAAIASAALMTLLDPSQELLDTGAGAGGEGGGRSGGSGAGGSAPSSPRGVGAGASGLQYVAEAQGSGWAGVVHAVCGVLAPLPPPQLAGATAGAPEVGEGGTVRFGVALWNALPVDFPLAGAELALRDDRGAFSVPLLDTSPIMTTTTGSSGGGGGDDGGGGEGSQRAAGDAAVLSPDVLLPGGWRRLVAAVPVRCSGALAATWVKLKLGPSASVAFRLGAGEAPAGPAPGADSPLPPFPAASGFQAGRCSLELPPRHSPPLLSISAPRFGLDGEAVRVRVVVQAQEDGIAGAKLVVKALHRESQQYVTLRLLSHPAAAGAAGSPPPQHAGRALRLEEGVGLGDLAGGAVHAVVVEATPQHRGGQLDIRAQLQYTCQPGAGAKAEPGKAVVGAVVPLEAPFRFDLGLLGPPRTHTLLQAPGVEAHALHTSPSELGRQMQGLSMQDSFSSVATERSGALPSPGGIAGTGPPSHQASSPLPHPASPGRERGLQPRQESLGMGGVPFVLPAGQRCTAVVAIRNHAPCEVGILSVDLLPPAAAASDSSQAPEDPNANPLPISITPAAPPCIDAARPGGGKEEGEEEGSSGGACARLHKGDTLTSLFSVSCTAAGQGPSLGRLVVRWHRMGLPAQQQHAARGGRKVSPPPLDELEEGGLADAEGAAGGGSKVLESVMVLPAVSFLAPLLTATLSYPPCATAGAPLGCCLQLANGGAGGVDVAAAVREAHGFVVAGPKATSLHVLPGTADALCWQFVPTHSGVLRLPAIALEAPALGHSLEVARGCELLVERALPHSS